MSGAGPGDGIAAGADRTVTPPRGGRATTAARAEDPALAAARPEDGARARRRAARGWAILVVGLVAAGIVGALVAGLGRTTARGALDPESAGADGTRAVAQLLRQHGVAVDVVRDRATAARRAAEPGTTLVLPDDPTLSDDGLAALTGAGGAVVLIDPHARGVRLLFADARPAGVGGTEPVAPDCALPEARRAGSVVPGTVFTPGASGVACYPAGGGFALLASEDGRAVAIDGTALFTNEHLAEGGNAALALNLLGRNATVAWFVPSLADSDLTDAAGGLGARTPPWVTPAILLLLLSAAGAALWRGRRFGPLVTERLPVTVRANETTEGRARLYARSRDAAHAGRAIRDGALARLRRRLGLTPSASPADVAAALAARTGLPLGPVSETLAGPPPTTDRALVALRDATADLEAALDAASARERTTP